MNSKQRRYKNRNTISQLIKKYHAKLTIMAADEIGDLMTVKDFIEEVNTGSFIDYDGFGYLATLTHMLDKYECRIYPSMITYQKLLIPKQFTHILWFNR
jgi:hypothetical protein